MLLTGMSGTGKSTLVGLLRARGVRAIDTDDGWVDVRPDGTQRWRVGDIRRLLAEAGAEVLVVAGCEENMVELLSDFDLIVLLSVPLPVLRDRLATRRSNRFGRDPEQLAGILADVAQVEPRLRAVADHELDTTGPPADTLAALLRVIADPGTP